MSNRAKAREALQSGLLETIEQKQAEARRVTAQLRRRLLDEGYDSRQGQVGRKRQAQQQRCSACGGYFRGPYTSNVGYVPGEEIVEYLDDDGRIVAAYHLLCARGS